MRDLSRSPSAPRHAARAASARPASGSSTPAGRTDLAAPERLRILGIDPGSRTTGYGLIEWTGLRGPAGRLRYLECGVLQADPRAPLEVRLGEIARSLTELVQEFHPAAFAVEDIFHGVNARSALALGQARGVVLAVAGMAGVTVHAYPPSVVKQSVTGRGRASKAQVAEMVRALVGLRRTPRADAADALAVAVTHAHRHPASSAGRTA